jgi:hypothetical protein
MKGKWHSRNVNFETNITGLICLVGSLPGKVQNKDRYENGRGGSGVIHHRLTEPDNQGIQHYFISGLNINIPMPIEIGSYDDSSLVRGSLSLSGPEPEIIEDVGREVSESLQYFLGEWKNA